MVKGVIDETFRAWKANRVNGASMSMLIYGDTDAYLMKVFDKVMEESINSDRLEGIFKK